MELIDLKAEIEKLAHTLKQFLETDIIVVDKHLNRIINTFEYNKNPIDIKVNSVVGNIIVTARKKIVRDKKCSEECMNCPEFEQCEIGSIAGVPIMDGNSCAGVIAILVKPRTDRTSKWTLDDAVTFLQQMAEMIAGKIQSNYYREEVENVNKSTGNILNVVKEPIVIFNEEREILFVNQEFKDFFMEDGEEWEALSVDVCLDRKSMFKRQGEQGYDVGARFLEESRGILRLARVQKNTGKNESEQFIYIFEKIDIAFMRKKQAKILDLKSWVEKYFSDSNAMRKAREAARQAVYNELSILVEGSYKEENDEIVKMFLMQYAADGRGMLEIECGKVERLLEQELFGVAGRFQGSITMARGSAVGLYSIEKLPMYLQKRMAEYLTALQEKGGFGGGIRLIASSSVNLQEQVERGLFSEELFYYVFQNYIAIPDVRESREDLKFYFKRYLDYYGHIYKKSDYKITTDAMEYLADSEWSQGRQTIRTFSELIIKNMEKNEITVDKIKRLQFKYGYRTLEKEGRCNPEQIKELLRYSEKSKKEIAEDLGIGRATLYRWMKKYNI